MIPLSYLFWRQVVNAFRRAAKTPRIMIPGLIVTLGLSLQILAYAFLYYSSPERGAAGTIKGFATNELLEGKAEAFVVAIRGALALSVFSAIIAALGDGGLNFCSADIDFLFPAPLSRRIILLFKMAGRYLSLLAVACYLTFALGMSLLTAQADPVRLLPGALGVWLFLISVTNGAQTALLAFPATESEASRVRRASVRRIFMGVLLFLMGFALYLFFTRDGYLWREIVRIVNTQQSMRLLFPDSWAAELFLSAFEGWKMSDTLRALGLLTLLGISFLWLFARERDFYEGAIVSTTKRVQAANALQRGDAGQVLTQMAQEGQLRRDRTLRDFGIGAWAILWKDCVAATRIPPRAYLQLLIPAAMPALIGGWLGYSQGGAGGVGIMAWMFFFAVQTPSLFMLGLRDMLRRADISRALPLSPLSNLVAEIALPVVQLTLLGWLSLMISSFFGMWRGPLLPVAFLILPTLTALLYFVQTIFVLLYPIPGDAAQNAVSNALSLGLSLLATVPGIAIGIALYVNDISLWGAGIATALVNLIIAAVSLLVASRLWATFDPAD